MEKHQYRVLQVVGIMNRGGTENMIMNYYRAIDHSKLQFDFIVHKNEKGAFDDEIEALGGRIFRAPAIRPWSYVKYFKWLNSFFSEYAADFIAIHAHIQENSGFSLYFAKKHGIKNRIMTSHTAPQKKDYKFIFREFARPFFKRSVTMKLACGGKAGKYLYRSNDFIILPNAIDISRFSFNQEIRGKIRNKLGFGKDQIVIGHVGRFDRAKNHKFIIDVFDYCLKKNNNVILLLVGDGYLRDSMKKYSEQLNISENVLFTGGCSNVNEILQAMDVFFMPSLYEGLPVSVIEAQASGLHCVLSDTIDRSTDITGNVKFLSLNQPIAEWSNEIMKMAKNPRINTEQKIRKAGFDTKNNLNQLQSIYGIMK